MNKKRKYLVHWIINIILMNLIIYSCVFAYNKYEWGFSMVVIFTIGMYIQNIILNKEPDD